MNYSRILIHEFLQQKGLLVDVRTPSEYGHAHIPGAVNLPIFDDEERKIVGTTYKQNSRETAIKIGLDFFGPKMRKMVEEVEGLAPRASNIRLYCWRGGMRSAAIAWLLNMYGFKVSVLMGGYKSFRNLVLQTFEQPYTFHVLGGFTGSGKTEVLQELKSKSERVIDLEAIASHKGSAFGSIGMPKQPSQEMFENNLAIELLHYSQLSTHRSPIWLEDESQRIGAVNIPAAFWKNMRQSPVYFLDIPFEERLIHLVSEYGNCDKAILSAAIERISKRLGGLETKNALTALAEDKIKECFAILLRYYDKHYLKGLHNRENLEQLLTKISCEKVDSNNANLLSIKTMPA